jgi:glycosyltransferase involved in cell wall biosynthesis
MRILLVTHYFPPEIGAPQARLFEFARLWTQAGHEVTVLTGMPNHPTGVVPSRYRRHLSLEERVDGYRVVRTWLYATPNEGIARKTLGHLSFMATSLLFGMRSVGDPEVVVVSSPTFFSILSAWALARLRRSRFVVEVRDLWPAIFVQLGVLQNRWLIKALEAIELASYRAADAVVVVSEGFRENLVARGVSPTKVHVIRNGVDAERFRADLAGDPALRRLLGARPGDLLALYVGAHGISHGLTAVAEAAGKLLGEPIQFAFVGEGAAKAELAERVKELGLDNVTFRGGVPREQVPSLLAVADVCLAPLRDVPLFSSFIPSKIFEYLGAGKPVIGALRGEPAAILRDAGQVVVDPEDPGALADALRCLARDGERRQEMGERGRQFVLDHFDRRRQATVYLELLDGLVDEGSTGPSAITGGSQR